MCLHGIWYQFKWHIVNKSTKTGHNIMKIITKHKIHQIYQNLQIIFSTRHIGVWWIGIEFKTLDAFHITHTDAQSLHQGLHSDCITNFGDSNPSAEQAALTTYVNGHLPWRYCQVNDNSLVPVIVKLYTPHPTHSPAPVAAQVVLRRNESHVTIIISSPPHQQWYWQA